MQTKGGGKHDILSVGRATATTPECLWMRPRDPDADMCPDATTASVSTEDAWRIRATFRVRRVPPADRTSAQSVARRRRLGYDQTTEEFMARQQRNDRPIRRAR